MSSSSSSGSIDRAATTPFLLRCFFNVNRRNTSQDYRGVRDGIFPRNELLFYTWQDATLTEIGTLLKSQIDASRGKNVAIQFDLVYPERSGQFVLKPIGRLTSQPGPDDNKTLKDLSFQVGDYLDITIHTNNQQNASRGGR
jgi:histone deacetylase complex subunit SAP18